MKTNQILFALALGLGIAGAANAQVISYSPRSGDVWVDSELGYMNGYGRNYNDNFVDDIVSNFGAPRFLVNDLLTSRRWNPGDVYYACAIAHQAGRPCGDVANMYEQNRGQGWGVIAQRMGIKPGSAEFHALKGQMGKSHGRYSTYSGSHPMRRDDNYGNEAYGKDKHGKDKHGNGKHGNGKHALNPQWDDGSYGNSGREHGDGDGGGNEHGNGGGKEHGNGGGKGKNH